MNKKISVITLLTVFSTVLVTPDLAFAQTEKEINQEERQQERKERIETRRENTQERKEQFQENKKERQQNRAENLSERSQNRFDRHWKYITERLNRITKRLKEAGKDTTALESSIDTLEEKARAVRTAYAELDTKIESGNKDEIKTMHENVKTAREALKKYYKETVRNEIKKLINK